VLFVYVGRARKRTLFRGEARGSRNGGTFELGRGIGENSTGRTQIDMKKNLLFYTVMLMVFTSGIYLLMVFGSRLESKQQVGEQGVSLSNVASNRKWHEGMVSALGDAGKYLYQNLREPLTILLLQVIVIITAARLTGSILVEFGQPAFVEEIIAGILLGPSLFGLVFPAGWSFLFQGPSMEILKLLGQTATLSRQAHNSRHLLSIGITLAAHLRSYVKHRSLDN
jgi:hypothetical protein